MKYDRNCPAYTFPQINKTHFQVSDGSQEVVERVKKNKKRASLPSGHGTYIHNLWGNQIREGCIFHPSPILRTAIVAEVPTNFHVGTEWVPPTSEEPCLQNSLENRKDGISKAPSGFFISVGMWETELLGIVKSQLLLPNELRRIYCKKRWYWGSALFVFKDLVLNLAEQIFCRVWLFLQNLIQSPLKSGQISP